MSIGGPPSRSPQLSPDGKWVWDGKQWLPVTGASPPPRPPQLSPDGKWVWDGQQWLPVARREAVFPAFAAVAIEQPEPEAAPEPVEPEPTSEIGEEGEQDPYAYSYVQAESATPLWERAQTGLNKYLYIAAGVVVLIIGAIWLNSLSGYVVFPWDQTSTIPPRVSPTPTIAARTDSAAADRYLNGFLAPAWGNLAQAENLMGEVCNGLLTLSCRDDVTATDSQVKNLMSVMDHLTPAPCIAAPAAKMRVDLTNVDKGLQLALQGYRDNKAGELAQGLAQYRGANQNLAADRAAAQAAQKSVCNSQITGPSAA